MSKSGERQRERRRRERDKRHRREQAKTAATKCPPGQPGAEPVALSEPVRGRTAETIDASLRWHMARTAPRMGVRALRDLREAEAATFLPRASEVVVRRGRRVIRHTPLIIRTVFVGVRDDAHLAQVRAQPGIAEIVCHPEPDGGPQGNVSGMVMRPAELDPVELQRFINAIAGSEIVEPMGVGVGSSVIVASGPFASFPATVEAILPGDRVKVALMIFGRASRLDLSLAEVQRV